MSDTEAQAATTAETATQEAAGITITTTTGTATVDPPAPKVFDEEYVKQLRNEAAATRRKLKDFEEAEEARKQAEMTETEKLKARAEAAEAKAKALEVAVLRTKAANAHKLPENLHKFVTADTEEEATAQAQELADALRAEAAETKTSAAALPNSGGRAPALQGTKVGFSDEQKAQNDRRISQAF